MAHMQHIGWWSGEVGALHKPLSGEPSPRSQVYIGGILDAMFGPMMCLKNNQHACT